MKIADVELNPADHKKNSQSDREAVFAHIKDYAKKKEAVDELNKAIDDLPKDDEKSKAVITEKKALIEPAK